MATQGPLYPGTTANLSNAGTSENAEAWVNPGNIVSDNGTEAQITAHLEFVRGRIREELITAAYGADAGNQFFILNEVTTQRAVAALPQARQLAENRRALSDRQ